MNKVIILFFLLDVYVIYGIVCMTMELKSKESKCGNSCEEYDSILPNCTAIVTDKASYCVTEAKKICLARDPNYCHFHWQSCNIDFSCHSNIRNSYTDFHVKFFSIILLGSFLVKYFFSTITFMISFIDTTINPPELDEYLFKKHSSYVTHIVIVYILICVILMYNYISSYYIGYLSILMVSTYYIFHTKLIDKLEGKKF